jgi:hypothetical protein
MYSVQEEKVEVLNPIKVAQNAIIEWMCEIVNIENMKQINISFIRTCCLGCLLLVRILYNF